MQSKRLSMIETLTHTFVGLIVSYLINIYVLPLIGINVSHGQSTAMIMIFTVASIIRQYCLRRAFNRLHVRLSKL